MVPLISDHLLSVADLKFNAAVLLITIATNSGPIDRFRRQIVSVGDPPQQFTIAALFESSDKGPQALLWAPHQSMRKVRLNHLKSVGDDLHYLSCEGAVNEMIASLKDTVGRKEIQFVKETEEEDEKETEKGQEPDKESEKPKKARLKLEVKEGKKVEEGMKKSLRLKEKKDAKEPKAMKEDEEKREKDEKALELQLRESEAMGLEERSGSDDDESGDEDALEKLEVDIVEKPKKVTGSSRKGRGGGQSGSVASRLKSKPRKASQYGPSPSKKANEEVPKRGGRGLKRSSPDSESTAPTDFDEFRRQLLKEEKKVLDSRLKTFEREMLRSIRQQEEEATVREGKNWRKGKASTDQERVETEENYALICRICGAIIDSPLSRHNCEPRHHAGVPEELKYPHFQQEVPPWHQYPSYAPPFAPSGPQMTYFPQQRPNQRGCDGRCNHARSCRCLHCEEEHPW